MSAVVAISIASAAPLLWAAMGGLLSERSGVVNIALEGQMLAGALAAVIGSGFTGSPWIGLACAAVAGSSLGAMHAWLCLECRIDHIVSGVAINLLAAGGTGYAVQAIYDQPGTTLPVPKLGYWSLGGLESLEISPLHLLLGVIWIVLFIVMTRTPLGIRLHAAGEAPRALQAAGIRVNRIRSLAVVVGGALAGIGGAELSIHQIDHFSIGMSGGRGFLALAALICGRWRPVGIVIACMVFGVLDTVGHFMQNMLSLPGQLILTFPFMAALLALGISGWGCRPPSALGKE